MSCINSYQYRYVSFENLVATFFKQFLKFHRIIKPAPAGAGQPPAGPA